MLSLGCSWVTVSSVMPYLSQPHLQSYFSPRCVDIQVPTQIYLFICVTWDVGSHEPVLIFCYSESHVQNHSVKTVCMSLLSICSDDNTDSCHFSCAHYRRQRWSLKGTRSSCLFITWWLEAGIVICSQNLTYFTYLLINGFSKYTMIVTAPNIV